MILVVVLGFFLVLSGIVAEEFLAVRQAETTVRKIYLKEQAYWEAVSVLRFLPLLFRSDDASYDCLRDPWARPLELPLSEGRVRLRVVDEERYLNLNLARTPAGLEVVRRLFRVLHITSLSPETLRVWITGSGFWDREFPPRRAPLDSLEELFLLGISRDDFYGKVEGFTFYPGLSSVATVRSNGRVNLNTAPVEVLMALSPRLDRTLAENLIEYRREHPFKKVEEVILVPGFDFRLLHDLRPWVTVRSENFRVSVEVRVGAVEGELEAVVKRSGGSLRVVYWRFS